MHFKAELGPDNVYAIHTSAEDNPRKTKQRPAPRYTHFFLKESFAYNQLDAMIKDGGRIETVTLTEDSPFTTVEAEYQEQGVVILFFIDDRDKVHLNSEQRRPEPQTGWKMIVLFPPPERAERGEKDVPSPKRQAEHNG
jgi:hypothetical protein